MLCGARVLLASAAVTAALVPGAHAAMGAVKLDNYTLDKFISIPGLTVLAKLDKSYPYGEKEDAFKDLCKRVFPIKNFIIGEIPVAEYGDMENDDLRQRFKVEKDQMPAYFLFKGSEAFVKFEGFPDPSAVKPATWDDDEDGEWEPPMKSDINVDNLVLWLRQNGVAVPAVGTIAELNEVAKRFMKEPKTSDLDEATKMAKDDFPHDPKASVYVKIMEKVLEKGVGYVKGELGRVTRIMAGKITPEKHVQLTEKERILNAFLEQ